MPNLKSYAPGLAVAMMLACCAIPNLTRAADNQPQAAMSASEAQRYVGQDLWLPLSTHISVCPELKISPACVQRSGHFKVDSVGPITDSLVGLRVTFDGAPTGWTALSPDVMAKIFQIKAMALGIYPSFLDHLTKRAADERRKLPGVLIGMNEGEALASAWGTPLSKKTVQSRRGLREEWHYPHGNVLYFHNGVLEGYEK